MHASKGTTPRVVKLIEITQQATVGGPGGWAELSHLAYTDALDIVSLPARDSTQLADRVCETRAKYVRNPMHHKPDPLVVYVERGGWQPAGGYMLEHTEYVC